MAVESFVQLVNKVFDYTNISVKEHVQIFHGVKIARGISQSRNSKKIYCAEKSRKIFFSTRIIATATKEMARQQGQIIDTRLVEFKSHLTFLKKIQQNFFL